MLRKNPWLIIVIFCVLIPVLLLAAAGAKLWFGNDYILAVTLNGEREVTVEYETAYEEQGAVARFYGSLFDREPVNALVDITGSVDTNKLGAYTVAYSAEYDGYIGTAYRRVHVVDTQAPVITLISDPEYFTLPGREYVEEGFTATDNHDGDITDKVIRTVSGDVVTYQVTDSSGNATTVTRQIVYFDPIAPELTLNGGSQVNVYAGSTYIDPGYTALDNCDGDITAQVKVTGPKVDTFRPGSQYVFTYTVTDAFGNSTTATRTVTVVPHPEPVIVEPEGKVIYLTFDDGPGEYTEALLGVLKKHNIKATFFAVNTNRVDLLARIAQEGHTIGIHSATHVFKDVYASEEAFFADLHKMQDVIYEHTGQTARLIRFPGGSSNTISKFNPGIMTRLSELVEAHGFRYFDWNVDSDDAGRAKTANTVYNNVISAVQEYDRSVVLQHDIKEFSVNAVERIIKWGLVNGYTFLPLTYDSPDCQHVIQN